MVCGCFLVNSNPQDLSNSGYQILRKACLFVGEQRGGQTCMFGHYIDNKICRICGRCISVWVREQMTGKDVDSDDDVFISSVWM